MEPKDFCTYCKCEVDASHWYWMKDSRYSAGGKWRCRQQKRDAQARYRAKRKEDPERLKQYHEYQQQYHKKNPEIARYKAYVSSDRAKGHKNTLNRADAMRLMREPCFYCKSSSGGLDRRDPSRGHQLNNVVPCCEKCNIILGDLPPEAKDILASGLESIHNLQLLKDWEIPTKRR